MSLAQPSTASLHSQQARCIKCSVALEVVNDLQTGTSSIPNAELSVIKEDDFDVVLSYTQGQQQALQQGQHQQLHSNLSSTPSSSQDSAGAGGSLQDGGDSEQRRKQNARNDKDKIVAKVERILLLATGKQTLISTTNEQGGATGSLSALGSAANSGGNSTSSSSGAAAGGQQASNSALGVCDLCVSKVINEAKRQVQEVKENRRKLEVALKKLEDQESTSQEHNLFSTQTSTANSNSSSSSTKAANLTKSLQSEEANLKQQLQSLQAEERQLLQESKQLDGEIAKLQQEELELYRDKLSNYQIELFDFDDNRKKLEAIELYTKLELTRLKQSSVLNDAFHITCGFSAADDGYSSSAGRGGYLHPEGASNYSSANTTSDMLSIQQSAQQFGKINGFRLGRLPEVDVSWDEINSAWGFVCLLLDTLVRKLRIPEGELSYRLQPCGNTSSVVDCASGQTLELYGSEGSFTRFYSARRFDQAMVGFLITTKEVAEWLHARDKNVRLPFKIEPDGSKIGGFKISLQFNELERWTKALKFLLINLKWTIAFLESSGHRELDEAELTEPNQ
ncbi:unnamed protein product [Amoebophrya sp. A120]|nr:unnamed protein product [Amoebophrya sp. A120]|eukprot:GSA120T00021967001.1